MERSTPNLRRHSAFTLVELLAVVAVVGVLCAISSAALTKTRESARHTIKLTAARQLMAAYLIAAGDNRGVLMAGLQPGATAYNESGTEIGFAEVAKRWPHRLRPYLGDRFKETLFVNEQALFYDELQRSYSGTMLDYMLSITPSFGMNHRFVGGDGSGSPRYATVTRLNQCESPGSLIAFAASRLRGFNNSENSGYFHVGAPYEWAAVSGRNEDDITDDSQLGYLAFHDDKVLVAFLDGHVGTLDYDTLNDMRLWSNQARIENNPNLVP